jgi:hypothetical protein
MGFPSWSSSTRHLSFRCPRALASSSRNESHGPSPRRGCEDRRDLPRHHLPPKGSASTRCLRKERSVPARRPHPTTSGLPAARALEARLYLARGRGIRFRPALAGVTFCRCPSTSAPRVEVRGGARGISTGPRSGATTPASPPACRNPTRQVAWARSPEDRLGWARTTGLPGASAHVGFTLVQHALLHASKRMRLSAREPKPAPRQPFHTEGLLGAVVHAAPCANTDIITLAEAGGPLPDCISFHFLRMARRHAARMLRGHPTMMSDVCSGQLLLDRGSASTRRPQRAVSRGTQLAASSTTSLHAARAPHGVGPSSQQRGRAEARQRVRCDRACTRPPGGDSWWWARHALPGSLLFRAPHWECACPS